MKRISCLKGSLFLLLFPLFVGCGEVRLIGAYDSKVDESIQAIAKEASTLFVKIDKDIDDHTDWSYPNFKNDYVQMEAELETLKIRVNGLPKYGIISKQIDDLSRAIQAVEQDHKTGFAAPGASITDLKRAIKVDQTGLEVSLSAMLTLQEGLKRTKADKSK
jgi:hypothetical protein